MRILFTLAGGRGHLEPILPIARAAAAHHDGALVHGLPMVLLPMGADQPLNAARCAALGVAEVLDAATATPASIGEAASIVPESPTHRRAARRLQREIETLPEPSHAIALLERLVRGEHRTSVDR